MASNQVTSLAKKISLSLLIILLVIITDQVLKNIAPKYLFVSCNKGVAFGIGISGLFLSVIVLGLLLYLLLTAKSKVLIFSLAMIFGGGVSNLIDRMSIGCVRDFISIGFFPSFNLADVLIMLGVILILIEMIFVKKIGKDEI